MTKSRSGRTVLSAAAIGFTALVVLPSPADAVVTRTSGTGEYFNVSWTEYDPEDLLGLPGNVHIGFLYAENGPYGSYVSGNVTDFDCDEGETPWGGHGFSEAVVDETVKVAGDATEDAIADIIDSGVSAIDAEFVTEAVTSELSKEIGEVIGEEFEEFPTCDYLGDRFLDGQGTTTVTVDTRKQIARMTGTLTVSNGGHGEPGNVLATPPIDVTITGGNWQRYESSYSVEGEGYKYTSWQKGTSYDGGTVTGGIGAMGFADDADDESYGGFSTFRYRTVDRVR